MNRCTKQLGREGRLDLDMAHRIFVVPSYRLYHRNERLFYDFRTGVNEKIGDLVSQHPIS